LQESRGQEKTWRSKIGTEDEEEGEALLVHHNLGGISQVCVPGEEEGTCQNYVETTDGLDTVKDGQVAQVGRIHFLRLLGLAHLIWLHVHLVDVADG